MVAMPRRATRPSPLSRQLAAKPAALRFPGDTEVHFPKNLHGHRVGERIQANRVWDRKPGLSVDSSAPPYQKTGTRTGFSAITPVPSGPKSAPNGANLVPRPRFRSG